MPRWHLFEIEDQPWLPSSIRDLLTDFLQFVSIRMALYRPVIPVLEEVLAKIGSRRVVDLCSGAAGPWTQLLDQGLDVSVTLTDRYPNLAAMARARDRYPAQIRVREEPVDARDLPSACDGMCTLFNGFHHFRPAEARSILQSVVNRRMAIGVFEIAEVSPRMLFSVLFGVPAMALLVTPWIRPLTLTRLFWTYLIPAVPVCLLWDGLISTLRTYSRNDLQRLAASTDSSEYIWRTGRLPAPFPGVAVTYLVGYPRLERHSPEEAVPDAPGSTTEL